MPKKTKDVDKIINDLIYTLKKNTIETQLLKPKLIRQLYKELGEPQEKDFPSEFKHVRYVDKVPRYTKYIVETTLRDMDDYNRSEVDYRIKKPSKIKEKIIADYLEDNWNITVHAHNVICGKFVQHPKYKNLAVFFYSSRDCSRYEYCIIKED